MALSDEQIVLTARQIGGLFDDLAVHYQSDDIVRFARAIEAEVRKDDEALIRQMLEALEYHRAQTRPIELTDEAITAGRARLEKAP